MLVFGAWGSAALANARPATLARIADTTRVAFFQLPPDI